MKTAVALRFLAFEDLGTLEPILEEHGYSIRYLDAGVNDLDAVSRADLVVVLGGPIGAHDGDRYPVVDQIIALLAERIAAGGATLGVCLGAQLIARALGADVLAGAGTEIGYGALSLTAEGAHSVLRHLDSRPVLHWHNDRFEIAAGAVRLASTDLCANQAFLYGANVLALQFHVEVPRRSIERWLIGHADALAAAGIDPRVLRADADKHGPAMEEAARLVLGEWLVGLS